MNVVAVGLLGLTVACSGNEDATNAQSERPTSRGTVIAPRAPIIVKSLPSGWSLTQAKLPTGGSPYWDQTLYLARDRQEPLHQAGTFLWRH